jgi:hypothetical protein
MIDFLSSDGVVELLAISVAKNLPMLKPSRRAVPLAELAGLDTGGCRVKERSGSLSLIPLDCGRATTSPLNSNNFKDGGVFVAAAKSGCGCAFAGLVVLPAARTPPDEPRQRNLYSKDPVLNVE